MALKCLTLEFLEAVEAPLLQHPFIAMPRRQELPRLTGKPPPYPSSQMSERSRTYMRRLSKPNIDYSARGPIVQQRATPLCIFDAVCSRLCAVMACFPRKSKSGTGILCHAAILAACLVSFSIAGSSLMASRRGSGMFSVFHNDDLVHDEPTDTALVEVETTLHAQFAVPIYVMQRLSQPPPSFLLRHPNEDEFRPCAAARLLLKFLTNRMNDVENVNPATAGSASSQRALFATVDGVDIEERVRAVASALAYAESTQRVPVIFWGIHHQQWNLSYSASFTDAAAIERKAVVVNYLLDDIPTGDAPAADSSKSVTQANSDGELQDIDHDHEVATADWAEFSVVDVVSDASMLESSDVVSTDESSGTSTSIHQPKTRDDIRTLDSAAAVDSHVSVVLTDEAVSRYAPRSLAATYVSSGLLKASNDLSRNAATAYAFENAFVDLSEEGVIRRLHESFHVPYLLLQGMRPHMLRLLLQNFVAKRASGVQKPQAVFVNVQFGLGNRLRALGSALAFARETNRVPVLIWVPDHHLNCLYRDLFVEQDEIAVNDGFDGGEGWPFEEQRAQDDKSKNVVWYNYMRQNGVHVHDPSELVVDDKDMHVYVSTAYVIQTPVTPYIIRTQSPFWSVLKSLTPQVTVGRLVERLDQMPLHKMMGVHIRSKLIESDISGIGVDEYSKESSKRTDYWRSLTQVDTFIGEMKKQSPTQLFYIAADNVEALEKLQEEFPSRIYYTARRCDGRDRECLPYALADMILLSKCTSIRGSYWSSFSELAVRMGGGRVLLAGIDFGRPSAKPRRPATKKTAPRRKQSKRRSKHRA